ncbi:MAG: glycosyltransferase family 87 protein, partial [Anaerolineales bacterium]
YEIGSAVWMPVAIGMFWPLGYLPLQQASNLWWILTLISLIAIVWLSSGYQRPPKYLFTVTLILAFLFPPTISHFSLGQITVLICFLFMVLSIYGQKLHPLLIAILIALTLSKPQLAIFILPGYIYSYIKENGSSQAVKLIFLIFLSIGILSIPLFIYYPRWIIDFFQNLMENPDWAHPSSLFLLRTNFNRIGEILWYMLLFLVSGINLWLWTRLPKRDAAVWSLALTTLVTPYIWSWDFVLLIPLIVSYLFNKKQKSSVWLIYFAYFSCWGVIAYMKLTGRISDELYWWVPWYLIGFVIFSSLLNWPSVKLRLNTLFS